MSRRPRILPVDLQEATGEPGIRVGKYCLVIDQWHLPLWPRACVRNLLTDALPLSLAPKVVALEESRANPFHAL